jgi:tetratricopeptide (TPR) repeat protein
VIGERPRFAPAYALRAKTQVLAGRNQAALEDLTTLAGLDAERTIDPESAQAYRQRGRHLRRLAAELEGTAQAPVLDLATDQLRKALKRGGPSAALFDDLGAALELQGRLAEAIDAYSQGLAQPEQHAKEHVKLYVKRGWAYTKLEDQYKKALADFSQAIRLDPRDAEACSGVSYALACLKVPVPAQYSAHALRHGGDDYLILHNLACVFAELSRSADADANLWQDLALALLARAVELWKIELARQGGATANERDLIRTDPALKPLHPRKEFQELIQGH